MNDEARSNMPRLVVTGASGFIGRNFVISSCNDYRMFCIARRSQQEVAIPVHENITWLQVDIGEWEQVALLIAYLQAMGGVDYVLHLGGFYDFSNKDHPAYTKTNIQGTKNILYLAEQIGARRIFFSSSLAGCEFTGKNASVNEESPLSARFPYARSKYKAELLIKGYTSRVPATIIRLAAVFSDWCEYPPLYIFLEMCLTKGFSSRFIAGRGEFSIPYIHVKDVIDFINVLITQEESLGDYGVYIASHPDSITLKDIYTTATRYFHNKSKRPVHIPAFLARSGLHLYGMVQAATSRESFLKPWMARYIDKQLNVNPEWTFKALNWYPKHRYHLLRRLLFVLENKASFANNWHFRNQTLLEQRTAYRYSTQVYKAMYQVRDEVVAVVVRDIFDPDNASRFPNYRNMNREVFTQYTYLIFQLFALAVRNRDRSFLTDYNKIMCTYRFSEGYPVEETQEFILTFSSHLRKVLLKEIDRSIRAQMNNFITLTAQYMIDEREDIYEELRRDPPENLPVVHGAYSIQESDELKWLVRRLETVCGDPLQF